MSSVYDVDQLMCVATTQAGRLMDVVGIVDNEVFTLQQHPMPPKDKAGAPIKPTEYQKNRQALIKLRRDMMRMIFDFYMQDTPAEQLEFRLTALEVVVRQIEVFARTAPKKVPPSLWADPTMVIEQAQEIANDMVVLGKQKTDVVTQYVQSSEDQAATQQSNDAWKTYTEKDAPATAKVAR